MTSVDTKFVTSDGLRLWTERTGSADAPAVLLVMGTSAPAIGWPDELVETLATGGRQVLRFDHRDTGRSDCVDFAARPYALADMAADALAVLDRYEIEAAHVVGASLGGAIAQWLAVHRPERVRTLTSIMAGPMGHDAGPAWARALGGQEPDPGDLPPPAARFLAHLGRLATMPRTTREEIVAADLETWRVLCGGEAVPFDEDAARRFVETAYDQANDYAAATNHDLAGRRMTADRLVPLSSIAAPTLVVHGSEDPLRPPEHGAAVAAAIPGARLRTISAMGHGFFSPGLPRRVAGLVLGHTAGPGLMRSHEGLREA
ncbi:alpha/beta hydrolase [Actinomadura sp. DC4]|uniref:alpha/beta fold hydrolase n=1 Tax=Actinomadura sp. DC4 TaxID=3055069 RepID=UPI0025B1BC31|nr:alpha/beta hydrolase [Actinomadura sp. DC4]MDN3352006.1 alpha/beta hydrolase [Actinomadura sp. DC4]